MTVAMVSADNIIMEGKVEFRCGGEQFICFLFLLFCISTLFYTNYDSGN